MGTTVTRAKRLYGAHPLHLLSLLASFALVGYVISLLGRPLAVERPGLVAVDHRVVPRRPSSSTTSCCSRSTPWPTGRSEPAGGPSPGGHRRRPRRCRPATTCGIPVMASGLLFLMFFPGIIRQGSASYLRATGLTQQPFLGRWLLLTGAFFAVSAIAYAAATLRVRRRHGSARRRTADGRVTGGGVRTRGPGRRRRRSAMVTLCPDSRRCGSDPVGCTHDPVPVPVRHVVGTDALYRPHRHRGALLDLHVRRGPAAAHHRTMAGRRCLDPGGPGGGRGPPRTLHGSHRRRRVRAREVDDRPGPAGGCRRSAWTCRRPPSR